MKNVISGQNDKIHPSFLTKKGLKERTEGGTTRVLVGSIYSFSLAFYDFLKNKEKI